MGVSGPAQTDITRLTGVLGPLLTGVLGPLLTGVLGLLLTGVTGPLAGVPTPASIPLVPSDSPTTVTTISGH